MTRRAPKLDELERQLEILEALAASDLPTPEELGMRITSLDRDSDRCQAYAYRIGQIQGRIAAVRLEFDIARSRR